MKRHKKIVILCHCILNVNSKVEGLATYPGTMKSLVAGYIDRGCGIIQLPCPETTFCGLQRWGMSKNQYDHPNYRKHCRELLAPVVDQIQIYRENGYSIEEIVCIDGSPSCGLNLVHVGYRGGMVDTDATDPDRVREVHEKGVFIDELDRMVAERGVHLKFVAVDERAATE